MFYYLLIKYILLHKIYMKFYVEFFHNYYILTDNKCFVTGSYEVQKYVIDTMRLATTPDHFCAPTFEKPGDGTIVVLSPRNSAAHGYKYKFYDADSTDQHRAYGDRHCCSGFPCSESIQAPRPLPRRTC